jgi:N-acetylmuramoyl-L-alanine amidase
LALLAALTVGQAAWARPVVGELDGGMRAVLSDHHRIFLEAPPERGEGLLAFARRFCGTSKAAPEIRRANRGVKELRVGVRYRVPYELLSSSYRLAVLKAIFRDDRAEVEGWRHRVAGVGPLGRESLWHLALWFTGKGENYRALRDQNHLEDEDLPAGATLLIPRHLLLPVLQAALPTRSVQTGTSFRLQYGKDQQGDYAVYRLRAGEALYSSVVVRFTGRVYAADVNALAEEIARRSGIADVTDIPVGYPVKVAFDLLLAEFLPAEHPRRQEYEANLRASAQFSNPVRTLDLGGITVILDAGHGGRDVGASMHGVWESLYVYDVMLRVRDLLETRTAARVVPTTRDGDRFTVEERDVLSYSQKHQVLTTPPYSIADASTGVNLRWYLANSVYRESVARNGDSGKVVFVSIHADSRHPSLRGAMFYVPAAGLRRGTYGKGGAVYASRKEVQEKPRVSFSWRQRIKSEGLSRQLAEWLMASFNRHDVAVNRYSPVRGKVIRNRREWVPAVLRANAVPAKILIEVCNLANPSDRKLIQTRSFRQKAAQAIVEGIRTYYGPSSEAAGAQVAKAAK